MLLPFCQRIWILGQLARVPGGGPENRKRIIECDRKTIDRKIDTKQWESNDRSSAGDIEDRVSDLFSFLGNDRRG